MKLLNTKSVVYSTEKSYLFSNFPDNGGFYFSWHTKFPYLFLISRGSLIVETLCGEIFHLELLKSNEDLVSHIFRACACN